MPRDRGDVRARDRGHAQEEEYGCGWRTWRLANPDNWRYCMRNPSQPCDCDARRPFPFLAARLFDDRPAALCRGAAAQSTNRKDRGGNFTATHRSHHTQAGLISYPSYAVGNAIAYHRYRRGAALD